MDVVPEKESSIAALHWHANLIRHCIECVCLAETFARVAASTSSKYDPNQKKIILELYLFAVLVVYYFHDDYPRPIIRQVVVVVGVAVVVCGTGRFFFLH
jgi:hypothetical protein